MKRQLQLLFGYSLLIWSTGNGLMPLLPVYALELGASPTGAGAAVAAVYLALAAGTVATGRLLRLIGGRKRLLIATVTLPVPMLMLLGLVKAVWQMALLVAIVWFCAAVGLTLISIYTARYSDRARRGKIFGLMLMATPLGVVLGAATVGTLVELFGYPQMFLLLAVAWLGMLLLLATNFRDDDPSAQLADSPGSSARREDLSPLLLLLLATTLLSSISFLSGRLSTSLLMYNYDFSAGVIASTVAVGGLLALPIPPIIGALSDRIGRRGLLITTYLCAAVALVGIGGATQLWQFWAATALLSIASHAGSTVAVAFATDIMPAHVVGKGLSLLNAMPWVAGMISYAAGGYLSHMLGAPSLALVAAGISLAAGLLLALPRTARPTATAER